MATFEGTNANVIRDYLFAFNGYSRHKYYYVFNCTWLDPDADFSFFDVILIFWSVYLLPPSILSEAVRAQIRRAAACKVLFLQDEYRDVRVFNQMMSEMGINVMFTCVDERDHELFYPPSLVPSLEATYTVLTGYVPAYLEGIQSREEERSLDIGYRSREVPFCLGDLGREKKTIAERFQAISMERALQSDISVREEDRIYGDDWVRFLQGCRCVLGSPSGASVVDFTGEIRRNCESYLRATPGATYEEVKHRFFADLDGKVVIDTVSPRAFEAAALGCTLVQLEGAYGGILHPDEHYLRINRDYSNLDEVVNRIKDTGFCRGLRTRAYTDLIASGRYSYRTFIQEFDRRLARHVPDPLRARAISRARFYIERDQGILPYGDGYVVVPSWREVGSRARRRLAELSVRAIRRSRGDRLAGILLGSVPKGVLALRVALASPALRRVFLCYWSTPPAWSQIGIDELLKDLLKLEIVRRARAGTLQSRERFNLIATYDASGLVILRSVAARSPSDSAPPLGITVELETALLAGRVRGLVWDHSAFGQYMACQMRGARWTTIAFGKDGAYRFGAVTALYRYAPARIGSAVLAILRGVDSSGRLGPQGGPERERLGTISSKVRDVRVRGQRALRRLLSSAWAGSVPPGPSAGQSQEFWTRYNVTGHRLFESREESLRYFGWRSEQYFDYLQYMPVSGQDGRVVLDYGCGPGHDLVGFVEFSKPARLIGADVSYPSLEQARRRLALHGAQAELIQIAEEAERLPFADESVDYIHSSGVLHHLPDPLRVLRELRRVLRPDGRARLMVYNYDSVWLHLFAAYTVRFKRPRGRGLSVREAFGRSTDTADCPISQAWTPEEVTTMCEAAGLAVEHLGNAVSVREMAILPERFEAILEPDLEEEHRRFLLELTFDQRGVPRHGTRAAGIDGCYLLTPDRG